MTVNCQEHRSNDPCWQGVLGQRQVLGPLLLKWVVEEIKLCILYTKYNPKRCNGGFRSWLFSPLDCVALNGCKGPGIVEEFRILALEKFCLSQVWSTMATSCDCICQGILKSCMDNITSNNKLRWKHKSRGINTSCCRFIYSYKIILAKTEWKIPGDFSIHWINSGDLLPDSILSDVADNYPFMNSFSKVLSEGECRSGSYTLFTEVCSERN